MSQIPEIAEGYWMPRDENASASPGTVLVPDTKEEEIVETQQPENEADHDFLQRQYELAQLDRASRLRWEMIKRLTVCGVAFLNDAYDMFAINIVAMMLGFVYYNDAEGSAKNTVPKKWDTLIKIA
ncbi:hypothetical protein LPJ72_006208, partial [Coemansia sp. Benny D160-2]